MMSVSPVLQVQRIVDPLDGGERGGADGAGLREREALRHVADALGRHRHVLGVEAALRDCPSCSE